jgi:hypothetical protein
MRILSRGELHANALADLLETAWQIFSAQFRTRRLKTCP